MKIRRHKTVSKCIALLTALIVAVASVVNFHHHHESGPAICLCDGSHGKAICNECAHHHDCGSHDEHDDGSCAMKLAEYEAAKSSYSYMTVDSAAAADFAVLYAYALINRLYADENQATLSVPDDYGLPEKTEAAQQTRRGPPAFIIM